jgi:amino acid adenylation domain-containing protein
MSLVSKPVTETYLRHEAIRERCVHPSGSFVPFERAEIEQSIPSRFEQQAGRYPDRVAVQTESEQLTYSELNRAANRIAHAILERRGAGPEQVILLLEQGIPAVAVILGILKSGKTYVPLDPSLPHARLSYIAGQSQAGLLVTNGRNLSHVREIDAEHCQILNIDELAPDLSTGNLGLSIPVDRLAWIIYTSGSTGQPKGVMQMHRNVLHSMMNYTNYFHICPEDRLSVLFSFSTHAGSYSCLLPLLNGAALCPLDLKLVGPEYLTRWLSCQEITICGMVPTVFRRFAGSLSGDEQFPKLRLIYLGGEPVLKTDFELYRKRLPRECIFVNRPGSTEMDCIRLYFTDKETQVTTSTVPTGYAVPDKEVQIIDDQGEPVGYGRIGEIAVRSRYISTGYWQRPDLTQAAFPEGSDPDRPRTYRSGDLGQMHADGCLVHMGRKDHQVKIRGYRVETTEIESALLEFSDVKDAVVMAREYRPGDQRLVAYVVPRTEPPPTTSTLRRALAAKLPDYMVPGFFVTLPALPHAPNGKINRRALPAPEHARPNLDTPFEPPQTSTEQMLAKTWTEVLGLEPIGIDDNFFDLGGQSLDGARIISQMGASVQSFLNAPTIRGMASEIERRLRDPDATADSGPLVPIQPTGNSPPLFCLPGHDGGLLGYANLARYLPADRPVFGFASPQIEQNDTGYRLEELAERYLQAMRQRQPEGPYLLTGLCFGGQVAYEMARQLQAQGQNVTLLAMLECFNRQWSSNLTATSLLRHKLSHLVRRGALHLRGLARGGPTGAFDYLRERGRAVASHRNERAEQRAFDECIREGRPLPVRLRRARYANHAAAKSYAPRPYDGPALLLRASDPRAGQYPVPLMGWEGLLVGEVEIHDISDNLKGLLAEPVVREVAHHLGLAIASVTPPAPSRNP